MSANDLRRAAVRGFLAELLVFPTGLVTAAFLTRALGPRDYGQVALIYAAVGPAAWLVATTFAGRVGVKLLADAADWDSMAATLLRANLRLGLGAAIGFALAAPLVSRALGHPALAPLLAVAAVEVVALPIIRIHRDALTARGRYSWPALATVAYHTIRLGAIVGLVLAGWSLAGVVAANVVARLAELVVCRTRLRIPVRGTVPGGLGSARTLLGALFGYSVCLQLYNRIDLLLLGVLGAPADSVGHYGAAQSLAQAPGLFALVLSPLLIAAIRRAEREGDRTGIASLVDGSTRVGAGLWALAGPVAAAAPGLAPLLFGPEFGPAGPILGWLGVGAGAALMVAILSAHEVARGRIHRPVGAAAPMLATTAILALAWIPEAGGLGAARAVAAGGVTGAAVAVALGPADTRVRCLLALARAGVAGGAGFVGTDLASGAGIPAIAGLSLGLAVSVLVLLGSGLVSPRELRRVGAELIGRELEPAR
jgi:O-antigen/teichoic acid export membrane protein